MQYLSSSSLLKKGDTFDLVTNADIFRGNQIDIFCVNVIYTNASK